MHETLNYRQTSGFNEKDLSGRHLENLSSEVSVNSNIMKEKVEQLYSSVLRHTLSFKSGEKYVETTAVLQVLDDVKNEVENVWTALKSDPYYSSMKSVHDEPNTVAILKKEISSLRESNASLSENLREQLRLSQTQRSGQHNLSNQRRSAITSQFNSITPSYDSHLEQVNEDSDNNFDQPFLGNGHKNDFDAFDETNGSSAQAQDLPGYMQNDEEKDETIWEPRHHDVLCGKGYNVNQHKGNLYFRKLVSAVRNEYVVTPKDEKKFFAKKVLQHFRSLNPPVRFLKQAADNSPYVDIGEKLSLEKTRQALREGKPTIVRKLQSGELVIGKFVVATLLQQRSREIYAEVFPESISTGGPAGGRQEEVKGSEPWLPDKPKRLPSIIGGGTKSVSDQQNLHWNNMRGGMRTTSISNGFHNSSTMSETKESADIPESDVISPTGMFARHSQQQRNDTQNNQSISNSLNFDPKASKKFTSRNSHSLTGGVDRSEYEWRLRNSVRLEDFESLGKSKRRRSSMVKFVKTIQGACEGFDEDDDKSCDTFDQKIDAAISKIDEQIGDDELDNISFQMSSASLSDSIQSSDVKRRSVQFSTFSRRSTRMSLVLRQSFADIAADFEDEVDLDNNRIHDDQDKFQELPKIQSHYIPDVFKSQHDKRRSAIIESSEQFLAAMYGEGAATKLVRKQKRTSFVLDNVILSPITHDDLVEEICNKEMISSN